MTGGGISTGSPTTAFPDNPGPINVKVIRYDDSGVPRTIGTFRLEPGAAADVQVKADAAGRDDQFVFRALHGRVPVAMGNVLRTLEPGTSTTVPVDHTPPEIAAGVPRADAVYVLHQAVTASFACSDTGSGLASCDGSSASGQPLPTVAVGPAALSVVAVDRTGNSQSVSIPYAVTYAIELAGGEGAVVKNGRLRLSLRLADALGVNQSASSIPVRATALVSVDGKTRLELAEELEFDARLAAYSVDLKSAVMPTGDYRLHVEVAGDPATHAVPFHVK
jgi:antitoxin component of MazEF toxin-antitoxin module